MSPTSVDVNPWLTLQEAASYIKVRPRTLALWARRGTVPAHRLSGIKRHVWRFLRAELDAMLTEPSVALTDRRQDEGTTI
jgi:excisionase family DNA binding protein